MFTASTRGYAEAAIKKINKHKNYIKDKLTRDNCFTTRKGKYIKDLRIIKDRELKDIVIVDNLVESFGFQIDNGIPILEFNGQEGDQELLKLIPFLKELSSLEDVRPAIRERYHLDGLLELKKKDLDLFFKSRPT